MAAPMEIYKCENCGNIVEVLHGGAGEMSCCNQPMTLLNAATSDEGKEKHVPVVEKIDGGYKVTVGSVPHPMTEEHHIEWIELIGDGKVLRADLDPTGAPSASLCTDAQSVVVREHCNLHGVWKA